MDDHLAQELLRVCEDAARAGGRQLLAWLGRFGVQEKGVRDFVTDADHASQEAIRRVVAARFPEHEFVGEEHALEVLPESGASMTWIVDPLDGTTNYVHGYPHYAVSVAVARGSELLAGVVFDPVAEKCFVARSGGGAWCDGVRLKVSETRRVSEALVAVSLPARVKREDTDFLDFVEAVLLCQGVRRSGSAALNLAYVASGTLDAFWAAHIHPWDVAAGALLVREAGGVVSGRDGADFQLWRPHFVVAATDELRRELLGVSTPFAVRRS
jgi:myo-inositol-1(or 4)-monophosphatase